jgi:hypothetical protein
VDSITEGPARPSTQTSLRADRRRRREAGTLQRPSAEPARSDALDWDHFRELHYPGSRRHDLQAIVAYGEYRRTFAAGRPGESASSTTA